MYTTTGR